MDLFLLFLDLGRDGWGGGGNLYEMMVIGSSYDFIDCSYGGSKLGYVSMIHHCLDTCICICTSCSSCELHEKAAFLLIARSRQSHDFRTST